MKPDKCLTERLGCLDIGFGDLFVIAPAASMALAPIPIGTTDARAKQHRGARAIRMLQYDIDQGAQRGAECISTLYITLSSELKDKSRGICALDIVMTVKTSCVGLHSPKGEGRGKCH